MDKSKPYKPTVYSWDELYIKAVIQGCDNLFLQIIKEEPMYPKNYVNHDVQEFGLKVKPSNLCADWIKEMNYGYILGYMHPDKEDGLSKGTYEICFPRVSAKGKPCEYVVSLNDDEWTPFI